MNILKEISNCKALDETVSLMREYKCEFKGFKLNRNDEQVELFFSNGRLTVEVVAEVLETNELNIPISFNVLFARIESLR